MQKISSFFFSFLLFIPCMTQLMADKITLANDADEIIEVEIQETDKFVDVMNYLRSFYQQDALIISSDSSSKEQYVAIFDGSVQPQNPERIYELGYKAEDKENVRAILDFLSKNTNWSIIASQSYLEGIYKKLAHVHPYSLLECVFLDKELKGMLNQIRTNKAVKDRLYAKFVKLFEQEANKNNLIVYVDQFAAKLNIKEKQIAHYVQSKKWIELIEYLAQR